MALSRVAIVAYFAVMLVAGIWLQDFYHVLLDSWVNYTIPFTPNYRVEAEDYPSLVDRVIVIAIDGIQPAILHRKYRELSGFNKILENGCLVENIKAIPPTLSTSGRASIITGLPPELAGVLSEEYNKGTLEVLTIFDLVREEDGRVVVVGDKYIAKIARYNIDEYVESKNDRDAVDKAISIAIKEKPKLLWLGLLELNDVALRYGVESREYEEKLEETARLLQHLLFSLEVNNVLENTLLVVVSTHGNIESGGYGGKEVEAASMVLLMTGPYVKGKSTNKTLYPILRAPIQPSGISLMHVVSRTYYSTSLAPTIALMLGLPSKLPSYSMPIFECLEDKAREQASYYGFDVALNFLVYTKSIATYYKVPYPEELRHAESLIRYGYEFTRAVSQRNTTSILAVLERTYYVIWDGYNKLKELILEEDIELRLLIVAVYTTVLVVLLVFAFRGLDSIHKLLALGISLVGYFLYYFYLVYFLELTPSFSSVVSLENVYVAGREALIPPLVAMMVILAIGSISIRSRENPYSYLRSTVASHVLLLTLLSIPIIYVILFYGYKPRFPPLDPDITHIFYTNLLYAVNILYFSPLFLVVALVSIILTRKYLTREVRVRIPRY